MISLGLGCNYQVLLLDYGLNNICPRQIIKEVIFMHEIPSIYGDLIINS